MEDLLHLPGVGKATKKDLMEMGYTTVSSLKNEDPEVMYAHHNKIKGYTDDRCVLYAYRCAVYSSNNIEKDLSNVKWWHFKD